MGFETVIAALVVVALVVVVISRTAVVVPQQSAYVVENLEQWAKLLRKTGDDAGAERMEARAKAIRDK